MQSEYGGDRSRLRASVVLAAHPSCLSPLTHRSVVECKLSVATTRPAPRDHARRRRPSPRARALRAARRERAHGRGIERAGRLVKQQQTGALHNGLRQVQPLAHAQAIAPIRPAGRAGRVRRVPARARGRIPRMPRRSDASNRRVSMPVQSGQSAMGSMTIPADDGE